MMNFFLRITTVLFCIVCFSSNINAQKKSRKMVKADQAFSLEQYNKAAELYQKAYQTTKSRAVKSEIIFKQAECYRLSGNKKRAESYYKRAIKAKYPDVIVYLRYADILRMNEKYEEAKEQYQKYIQLNPSDISGEMGFKSCDYAINWLANPTRYKVEIMPLVNSRFSDFSPSFGNGEYSEIYFTSSRSGGFSNKVDDRTGETFTDIYSSKLNKKGKWSVPIMLEEPINTAGNEGSVVLNKRGTTMYFTKCDVQKKKSLGCNIYVSNRKGKVWGPPTMLQIKVDSNTTLGHPTISEDETTLIFSSDLSGGYGGKDLWIVKQQKRGKWSDPVNLGPAVNTSNDEMFPFLHSDGTLYFASTGHIGMGGFDIFKSYLDENGNYSSITNLKYPVNTSGHDFGMIIEKSGERGYLTSDRKGGKGGDDIYQFELPPLVLSMRGVVTDSKTGAIITNAKVILSSSKGEGAETKTDNTGSYNFKLDPLLSYEILVASEGYLNKKMTETTVGIDKNKVFIIDVIMDPVKKEIILPKIEYDFAKWDLRDKSTSDLDMLAEALKDNPNVVIELKSHTDFVGDNKSNLRLSQKRADACISYLVSVGIDPGQLVAVGVGEDEPFVIEKKDGRFKEGDVLTESYINKIKFRKNKKKAHQYNRRTSFKVLREDYVPQSDSK
ncbi:MAG: OmpA family protein [Flavobacteriales bacterium]|nr:OmpA family protein [Flavobacteriales bacterium]